MAEYSFVKDQRGRIYGIWVKRPSDAQDQAYLIALLLKHGHSTDGLAGGYRVVPNHFDAEGGCFVMFGSATAPGEAQSGHGLGQPAQSTGGCFIATACYESPDCREVETLRQFRDLRMMPFPLGRCLIAAYYWFSPPIARLLKRHDTLRASVREHIMKPIVKWIETE